MSYRRLLAPALLLAAACATQDRVRTIGSIAETRAEGSETSESSLIADLATSRQLSHVWELRANDRSQWSNGTTVPATGPSTRFDSTVHQPRLTLDGQSDVWEAELSVDRLQSERRSSGAATELIRDSVFSRFGYQPIGLPLITIQADQIRTSDAGSLDLTDIRKILRIEHSIESFSAFYERIDRTETNENTRDVEERIEDRLQLTGDYNNDAGTFGARLGLSWSEQSRAVSGPQGDLGELPVASGLYALDTTPTLGALDLRGDLVDGNLSAGTGIQIGGLAAGGGTDRNLGVDQGAVPRAVDQLDLYTDVAFTAGEAREFNWSLYVSNDNLSWTRAQFSTASSYDVARQRFQIQTGGVASRYVKVVNTSYSATAPAVEVTEIRAFGREGGLEDGSTLKRTRADGAVSLSPSEQLRLFLEASAGSSEQALDGDPTAEEDLALLTLGANYNPLAWLSSSLRATDETYDDPLNERRERRLYSGFLGFTANPRLSFDFSASRLDEDRDGLPYLSNDSLTGRSTATFVHDIAASLFATRSQGSDFDVDRDTDSSVAGASLHAPLRTDLECRIDHELTSVRTREAGQETEVDSQRTGAGVSWYPTEKFSARADLDWVPKSVGDTGVSQFYQLNWLPLSDGQLQFQLAMSRRIGSALSGQSQSTQAQVRWQLERNAYLDLTSIWSEQTDSTGETIRARAVTLTVSVDF